MAPAPRCASLTASMTPDPGPRFQSLSADGLESSVVFPRANRETSRSAAGRGALSVQLQASKRIAPLCR